MCCICVLNSIFYRKIFNILDKDFDFNIICFAYNILFLLQNIFSKIQFFIDIYIRKVFLYTKKQFLTTLSILHKNISFYLKEI